MSESDRHPTGAGIRLALGASASLGLTFGLTDLTCSILTGPPPAFVRFPASLPALGGSILLLTLSSLVLLLPAALLPARLVPLRRGPLVAALAAAGGLALTVGIVYGLLILEPNPARNHLGFLTACLFLMVAIREYEVLSTLWTTAEGPPSVRTLLLAAPLIAAVGFLSAWTIAYPGARLPLRHWVAGALLVPISAILVRASARVATRIRIEFWLGAACLVGVLPMGLALAGNAGLDRPATPGGSRSIRHVLLVSIDTLRADEVAFLNPEGGVPTPSLDALAADSVVFTQARSPAPWTLSAISSILTGVSPPVHGVSNPNRRIPADLPVLAERMRQAGYLTAAFGQNPWLRPRHGVSRGFSEFEIGPRDERGRSLGTRLMARLSPLRYRPTLATEDITRLAREWLRRRAGADFFLWLHYLKPHGPYEPPAAFRPPGPPPPGIGYAYGSADRIRGGEVVPTPEQRAWIRKLYEGEVRAVDASVGKVMTELKQLGLYDDALIVLISDHGEEFWEHGGFEHGHTVYDELLRVPLFFKLPGRNPRREIPTPVSTGSVYPTLLSLCGVAYPPERLSYRSLEPDLSGNPPEASRPIYSSSTLYFENQESLVQGSLKYIRHQVSGREELYDLEADPRELNNLASVRIGNLDLLREALRTRRANQAALRILLGVEDESTRPIDEHTLRELRSLGYMQ